MKRVLGCFVLLVCVACSHVNTGIDPVTPDVSSETTLIQETETPLPTQTQIPTIVPTSTPLPVPTATFQSIESVYELIKTNGNCNELCFWGIIPGITTVEDFPAWTQNSPVSFRQSKDDRYDFSFTTDAETSYYGWLRVENGIVTSIKVTISSDSELTPNTREDWQFFSMASILEKFGTPSLILVDTEHSHELEPNQIEETVLHSYDFFFDDIGLIVGYDGGNIANAKNGAYTFCPGQDPVWSIDLWINSTENAPSRRYLPNIEEAAGIPNEVFRERLLADPENYCQEMRADVFSD
jgi:hypothetical protein